MQIDANLLLTAETLRLDPDLARGRAVKDVFSIKCVTAQTYLAVNERQMQVLEQFARLSSVPAALERCIRDRSCIALRDFYDLVLKACNAGILGTEQTVLLRRPALHWVLRLRANFLLLAAAAGGLAAIAILIQTTPLVPALKLDWLLGWLATCGALSLGGVFTASALRGAGCEVYRPHVRWQTGLPHFAVDDRDACMTTRRGRAAVILAPLIPLAFTVAAAVWYRQPWALVPLAVLLVLSRPFANGTFEKLLILFRRRPLLDTDGPSLLDAPMTLGEEWRLAWRRFDLRVTLLQLGAGVLWAFAVADIVHSLLGYDLVLTVADPDFWPQPLLAIGTGLALVLGLTLAAALQYRFVDTLRAAWRSWSLGWRRWRPAKNLLGASGNVDTVIRRNPLLRRLDGDVQNELAQQLRPFNAKAWRTLVAFADEPAEVGLILSGSATVYRRRKNGRRTRLVELAEGDLFNVHKLVDSEPETIEVRTRTPIVALAVDATEFKRLVIDKLGAESVKNYVHKHLFLQRSPLCTDWRPASVARLAELAGTASHSARAKIVEKGQEVRNLYVLYEGRARALRGSRQIGKIKPGDFFGEISLLQTSPAVADVETSDDSQCLLIDRVEFIRFMSRNHHVALQMERLCSKRLGHPIFPLTANSFEER